MKIHKHFFLVIGVMLSGVFGSLFLFMELELFLLKKNFQYLLQQNPEKIFVKIESIQNKSYFGYNHYYFTVSFHYKGKKMYALKKVSSSLYYKYKEGNQIESLILIDRFHNYKIFFVPQIFQEIELEKAKYTNIKEVCTVFCFLGFFFLGISFFMKS